MIMGCPILFTSVPAYGVGWTTIYQKMDKHIMSEGS